MKTEPAKWGDALPTECDLCHATIGEAFVDAKTEEGAWGLLCLPCFDRNGLGLGPGKGQLYQRAGEEFVCVRGSAER